MLIKLSIDNESAKGQNLQTDTINIDVEDSKKGCISDGCCCSCINNIEADFTLRCCTCDELYHSACIKRPVPASTVQIINESPNCWWTCLHCVLNLPIVNNTQIIATQQPKVDLDSFKETLLSEMRLLLNARNAKNNPQDLHRDSLKRKRDSLDEGLSTPKLRRTHSELPSINDDVVVSNINSSLEECNNDNVNNLIQTIRDNPTPSRELPNNTNQAQYQSVMTSSSQSHLLNSGPQPYETNSVSEKFILHYRPISTAVAINSHEEWRETRKLLSKNLKSVKITFSRFNVKNGRVKFGFPSLDHLNKAKEAIASSPESFWSYECYVPELLLPKLTVYNIPLDFDLPSSVTELSAVEYRDCVKDQLIKTIQEKNDSVKSLIDNQKAILEVIFVQKHKNSCTAALKVSPNMREHIVDICQGKLFVFSARCNVEDRFFYKQCFHCQALGHTSKDCPDSQADPVCMYCSGHHRSSTCPVKHDQKKHSCSNCNKSTDSSIFLNATSHNAASRFCPLAISFMDDIKSRTQLRPHPKNS